VLNRAEQAMPRLISCCLVYRLDGLNLEMQCDETENQGLQILDEVVKYSQPFGISGLGDINQGSNFGGLLFC
jgi:hypothetical protein